jgi:colanic acid/amylovoran biosynthesis glycosyltransferase
MTRRVVYVTAQFPFGSREAFLAAEVRELAKLVDIVHVVALRPQTRLSTLEGVEAYGLRSSSVAMYARAIRALMRWPRAAGKTFAAMCSARYRPAAKLKNVSVFVKGLALADLCQAVGADALHAHWLTTPSTAAVIAARLTNLPVSISAHRFDLFADNWVDGKLAAARFVRVISERSADVLRSRSPAALHAKIRVLHVGVELDDARQTTGNAIPGEAAALPGRAPVDSSRPALRLVAVGFLTPVKGHAYLIEAVAILRDLGVAVRCSIIGDGPLRIPLQAAIKRHDLAQSVLLRGVVPHARLMAELRSGSFDVLVHPSVEHGTEHEGIPVSLMEAMSHGLPCVATNTGSIGELIDAACGVLVPQRDASALARALQLLAHDEPLRAKLGLAARERVRAEFAVAQTTRALVDLMFAN